MRPNFRLSGRASSAVLCAGIDEVDRVTASSVHALYCTRSGPVLCRFSDACMTSPSTRSKVRRPRSANLCTFHPWDNPSMAPSAQQRTRGRAAFGQSAGTGEIGARGDSTPCARTTGLCRTLNPTRTPPSTLLHSRSCIQPLAHPTWGPSTYPTSRESRWLPSCHSRLRTRIHERCC